MLTELLLQIKVMVDYQKDNFNEWSEVTHQDELMVGDLGFLPFYILSKHNRPVKISEWPEV